MQKSKVHHDWY